MTSFFGLPDANFPLSLPEISRLSFINCVTISAIFPMLQGNIWLYAFYAGLMAGVFEECGRWLAFKLSLRWSRGPGDALMYGAGHGGIEAILLAGMTMLSNITLALALNRGGLEAVEAMMGPLSETGLAAIQGLCANPAGIYF